ncbi:signal peptide peptidase SppA [bacterium]|nr:signal peptide peptidase SppA [bacterium]
MGSKSKIVITIFVVLILFVAAFFFGALSYFAMEGTGDIAITKVEGFIFDVDEKINTLEKLRKNDDIKAVILRVNSPGGAIGASQELYQEVKRVAAEKPVIVSMGTIAASGGYYISSGATKIVANPGTLTGSIGVITKRLDLSKILDWAMIKYENFKGGKYKDMFAFSRPMTDEERDVLQELISRLHEQFKKDVSDSRKIDIEKVNEFATGRIITGEEALALGLIDEIGNIQSAIDLAKKLAGIEGEPDIFYPDKKKIKYLDYVMQNSKVGLFDKMERILTDASAGIYFLHE